MNAPSTWHEAYTASVTSAALLDIPARSVLHVTGADRIRFLHNFCTQAIDQLSVGASRETFFLTAQGKIVAHATVFIEQDRVALIGPAAQATALAQHLDRYVVRDDVQVVDASRQSLHRLLTGPNVSNLLEHTFPKLELADQHTVSIGNATEAELTLREVSWLDQPSWFVSALSTDGDLSLERWPDVVAGGEAAWHARRIESFWPEYGIDIDGSNLPQEVGRDQLTLHFQKGCYLGQETVARIDSMGHVNRQLVTIECAADATLMPGTKLTSDGKEIGQVTSHAFSPRRNACLAFAYVPTRNAEIGTAVMLNGLQGKIVKNGAAP